MAYTAIESMRRTNKQRFGRDLGPMQPPLYVTAEQPNDLKSSALRFLHERCEGLLFDPAVEAEEKRTGSYQGKSLSAHQIPFNMERDIDRLCLKNLWRHSLIPDRPKTPTPFITVFWRCS